MGASDRGLLDLTLHARVRDLDAVVDSLGLNKFVLAGLDLGAPVAVAYSVAPKAAVSHLVLISPWATGTDMFAIPEARRAMSSVPSAEQDWNVFAHVLASIVTGFDDPKLRALLVDIVKRGVSPQGLADYYEASEKMDVEDLLSRITVPTLVIHESGFPFGSFPLCRDVAAKVDGAQLVVDLRIAASSSLEGSHQPTPTSFPRLARSSRPRTVSTSRAVGRNNIS